MLVWSYYATQRFGYWRTGGFLAQKFNRRTNVEPCKNAHSKNFSRHYANTLLWGRFYFIIKSFDVRLSLAKPVLLELHSFRTILKLAFSI